MDDGLFSRWIANELNVGDTLSLQGPMGKCFYSADSNQKLLLGAIGTGLAPIVGMVRDALSQFHTGDIHLVVGAKQASDFYYQEELEMLSNQFLNLHLHWVSLEVCHNSRAITGDIYEYCRELSQDMREWRVYLCGAQSFVNKMRRQCLWPVHQCKISSRRYSFLLLRNRNPLLASCVFGWPAFFLLLIHACITRFINSFVFAGGA